MSRSIKIQSLVLPPKWGKPATIYPSLILKGKWLEDAGFLPDTHVKIHVEPNRLVIEYPHNAF